MRYNKKFSKKRAGKKFNKRKKKGRGKGKSLKTYTMSRGGIRL